MKNRTAMERLELLLLSTASPLVLFLMEDPPADPDPDPLAPGPKGLDKLQDLRDEMVDLNQQMNNIQARADSEKRPLSDEEDAEIEGLFARFDDVEAEIDRRERLIATNSRMSKPGGRRTDPDDAGQHAGARPRVPAQPVDPVAAGRGGFRSFGEFANSVKAAVRSAPGGVDPRLIANAPTTFGEEGVGEEGGFAVPPDFRREIMQKVAGEESLLSRTDQFTTGSNSMTVPKDETTPWQQTGGIQAFWEGEGTQFQQSKPLLDQSTIRLNKLTALVPVTSELLEDAPAMSSYLRKKTPEKIDFKVNDAIVNGTGAGQPKGILNADSKVTVPKEAGQLADTLKFLNITNMWSRLYAPCRRNAVWLVNQDIETQLLTMEFPSTAGTFPVFLPPGGLSQSPFSTLMGRPVLPTQAAQTIGDEGDIILTDLQQYLTALKVGGIRQDVSMHLWFDFDMMAFRFILRVAGQSWWTSAIAPKNGVNTLSCIVSLAERA